MGDEQKEHIRQRRIEAYFPDKSEREQFINDAKALGLSASHFVFHLYRLYRQGKLGQSNGGEKAA